MTTPFRDTLAAAGARFSQDDVQRVCDFGDASAELIAAAGATVLVPLGHYGVVQLSGEDAKSFLHNQLTSDVNHLAADGVQHAAWCTAKGRMLASFVSWREGDDYLLQMAAELVPAIAKRLQMYVLRSKVKVADISAERALLGLAGPDAEAALHSAGLPVPADAMKAAAFAEGKVLRLEAQRVEVVVAATAAAALWQKLVAKARPAGIPAWQWLDIRAGLPVVSGSTKEEFVPQMANFERIGGVSFHKGCYPGQEVVARTQYLGKVKRHLYRVRSDVALAAGDELYSTAAPDQSCGMIVTGTASPTGGFEALAVIMEAAADAGVHLRARDGAALQATAVATS